MTDQTKKDNLPESFDSSFGVNAHVPDPVSKGSNKRPADKTVGETTPPKSKMIADIVQMAASMSHPQLSGMYAKFAALANGGADTQAHNLSTIKSTVKEDFQGIFDGQDLSEDFREKATTLFEAAVDLRVSERVAELEEEFDNDLTEAVEAVRAELTESVEKYMDHVAEQWLEDNKLAVVNGIRADILESFLGGLKTLFQEHYIEVPEDKVDVVESLTAKVEELENRLNESENRALEGKKKLEEMEASNVLSDVTEGLTDTQAAKLKSLAESVQYTNADDYRTKLQTIVEGFITKKAVTPAEQQLNEALDLDTADDKGNKPVIADPLVAAVASRISKQAKN